MRLKVNLDGKEHDVDVNETEKNRFDITYDDKRYHVSVEPDTVSEQPRLVCPVAGKILWILKKGSKVKKGDRVATVYSMKMENHICARYDGEVADVHFAPGDFVKAGTIIADIKIFK